MLFTKSNQTNIGDIDVPAKEGYFGEAGVQQIVIESIQNDMALFESLIQSDVEELSLNESATEELIALAEATGVGFVEKVKEFLKNVWAKIKGLFEKFIAHLSNVVVRDNEKFVKMHKDKILKKDLSKMKYNEAEFNGFGFVKLNVIDNIVKDGSWDKYLASPENKIDQDRAQFSNSDFVAKQYGSVIGAGAVEPNEFYKEFMEKAFKDSEEKEGIGSAEIMKIMDVLTGSKDEIKELEKSKSEMEKKISKQLNALDKFRTKISALVPKGGKATDDAGKTVSMKAPAAAIAVKAVSLVYDEVKLAGSILNTVAGAKIAATKTRVAQSRAIFARAAAYNDKAVKENTTELGDGIDQEAFHETAMLFDKFAY